MKGCFAAICMAVVFSACATIVNSDRQQVFFKGGPEKGTTKIITPDGTFEADGGSGAFMMTRSKGDIPIKITCPDGSTKNGIVQTHFDWLLGGAGNVLNGGWGWFVDPFTNASRNIDDVSLRPYCKSDTSPTAH